ncbi:MAG: dihydrolipoamide acetyltransferase family protein [Actinomycetota bacterium]|nr:dihydrolipoamide acetyltransferase family protein [Actinomycetota bacterium]
MHELRMPSLGVDMDRGTVLQWLVGPGDTVRAGDIVVVIDTDKADIEAETFDSGTIGELLVEEGREVPVGTPLATILADDEVGAEVGAGPQPAPAAEATEPVTAAAGPPPVEVVPTAEVVPAVEVAPVEAPVPAPVAAAAGAAPGPTRGRAVSPLVRRLADEHHVDIAALSGSGPGGVVTRHDVEDAFARPVEPGGGNGHVRSSPLARRLASERGVTLAGLVGSGPGGAVVASDVPTGGVSAPTGADKGPADRRDRTREAIARAMARSKREIPHYYLDTTIDVGAAIDELRTRNEELPITRRVLPAALLLRATALAAADHPELNGHWIDGHRPADHVHLGVAISLRDGGLVAPAIADADRLDLDELMAALRDLVARARAGRLRARELTDATITVTSLGDLGVDRVLGVIHPPQLAMVGFGTIRYRPVCVDDTVVARPTVVASLAADHRASDGMAGAAFLADIERRLHDPLSSGEPPEGASAR